jgi:hypothetical protein
MAQHSGSIPTIQAVIGLQQSLTAAVTSLVNGQWRPSMFWVGAFYQHGLGILL